MNAVAVVQRTRDIGQKIVGVWSGKSSIRNFWTLEGTNVKMTMELNELRERHKNADVQMEEEMGLNHKVKALEKLRRKIVELEIAVEAGRQREE